MLNRKFHNHVKIRFINTFTADQMTHFRRYPNVIELINSSILLNIIRSSTCITFDISILKNIYVYYLKSIQKLIVKYNFNP